MNACHKNKFPDVCDTETHGEESIGCYRRCTAVASRDLPRHAAVDEGKAADQNGTGPALICSLPLIHWPGSARPQVAYSESAFWYIRIAGTRRTGSDSVCICVLLWLQNV